VQVTGIGRLTRTVVEVPGPAHTAGISRPMPPPCGRSRGALPTREAGSARADFAITAMPLGGKVALASGGGTGIGGAQRRASAAEGAEIIAMGNGTENRPRRWPLLPVRSVGESGTGETLAGPSPAGGSRAIFMPNEAERITGPAAARDGERRRSSPMSQARALSTGS